MLTKKYQPNSLSEVIGQELACKKILNFYKNFKNSRAKAVFLSGPPGCGKSSCVQALASQENAEIIEINASDKRNKNSVLEILEPASQQVSLFGSNKIIFVDEIDALSGTKDRGGVSALADIIKKTKFPVFLTANDPWSSNLKSIRKISEMISMSKLSPQQIFNYLKKICKKENIAYEDKAIMKLAYSVGGDLRAAINDLEVMSTKEKITLDTLKLWGREKDEIIQDVLKLIFKSRSSESLNSAVFNLDISAEDTMLWVEQNVSKEYSGEDLLKAYNCLSLSDIFFSRIMRWQHWRFLFYASYFSTTGVQQAKENIKSSLVYHTKPEFFLNMWKMSAKKKKYKELAEKFSDKLHASTKQLQKDFAPYLSFIENHNKKMHEKIMNSLN